jgi:hypothetical protein
VAVASEVEVHAAALYTALTRAGELRRAREFMEWWTTGKKISRRSSRSDDLDRTCTDCQSNPCMCWDDDFEGPDDYDADELGEDPE